MDNTERRRVEGEIEDDYREGFYISPGKIWEAIDSVNCYSAVPDGPYSILIPFFNEGVIREAICNAVAHRDYHIRAATIIKLSNDSFSIRNVGGFPPGVDLGNILSVKQICTRVRKLCEEGKLMSSGNNSATVYFLPHRATSAPRK